MITSYLQGGLGNQMFQIAAAIALAESNDDEAKFNPEWHYLPLQGNKCQHYLDNIYSNVIFDKKIKYEKLYEESNFHYEKIPYYPSVCLKGFFQSERYFSHCSEKIRDLFTPIKLVDKIESANKNLLNQSPVALHIRRGDYLKFSDVHPTCGVAYYKKAIDSFEKSRKFLIFSDDIEWCKKVFNGNRFLFAIDNKDYEDLLLFSLCPDAIIANSTFSWWGAWLNKNSQKQIIAPSRWFANSENNTADLIPEKWTVI